MQENKAEPKTEDDGQARFYVEADYHENPPVADIGFFVESHSAALALYDRLAARYPCVWMAEYGEYRVKNKMMRDWMYYRWTERVNWGPALRLTGYPENDIHELREYYAIDRQGNRVA